MRFACPYQWYIRVLFSFLRLKMLPSTLKEACHRRTSAFHSVYLPRPPVSLKRYEQTLILKIFVHTIASYIFVYTHTKIDPTEHSLQRTSLTDRFQRDDTCYARLKSVERETETRVFDCAVSMEKKKAEKRQGHSSRSTIRSRWSRYKIVDGWYPVFLFTASYSSSPLHLLFWKHLTWYFFRIPILYNSKRFCSFVFLFFVWNTFFTTI